MVRLSAGSIPAPPSELEPESKSAPSEFRERENPPIVIASENAPYSMSTGG